MLWLIPYLLVVYDNPSMHPPISVKETFYIVSNMELKADQVPTPWFHVFTCLAVWVIIAANFCYYWGLYTSLTSMLIYFKEVLGLSYQKDIITNGLCSAIPYTLFYFTTLNGGPLADLLCAKCLLTTMAGKLFTAILFYI